MAVTAVATHRCDSVQLVETDVHSVTDVNLRGGTLMRCLLRPWAMRRLSYYSDASLTARVPLDRHELLRARNALIDASPRCIRSSRSTTRPPPPRSAVAARRLSEVLQQIARTR